MPLFCDLKGCNTNNDSYFLEIKTSTWPHDSHNLYDYSQRRTDDMRRQTFRTYGRRNKYKLTDHGEKLALLSEEECVLTNCEDRVVAELEFESGREAVIRPTENNSVGMTHDSRMWLVVGCCTNKSARIRTKDTIRLGRNEMFVSRLVSDSNGEDEDPISLQMTYMIGLAAQAGTQREANSQDPVVSSSWESEVDESQGSIEEEETRVMPEEEDISLQESGVEEDLEVISTSPVMETSVHAGALGFHDFFESEEIELFENESKSSHEEYDSTKHRPQSGENFERTVSQLASCRFCYDPEEDPDNPLVVPCNCSGSLKYIHLACIRMWLQTRLQATSHTMFWRPLQCETCHETFRSKIYFTRNNEKVEVEIFETPRPDCPYAVLLPKVSESEVANGVYLLTFTKSRVCTFGRSQHMQFRMTDISVSRQHATLTFHDPQTNGPFPHFDIHNPGTTGDSGSKIFLLQEAGSKFGTLLLLRNGIRISSVTENICIQLGSTVIAFEFHKKRNEGLPCLNSKRRNQIEPDVQEIEKK
eukprot:GHVP01062610.1.p1 GENE.GHVP01062610.1~~GHVP01062610.1.p1  ORF type:complete len:538 (+),score=93.58 GHVP01062610.1:24-1616(+)